MSDQSISSPSQAGAPTHDDMANALRVLAMDAVEQAQSGHPGMPMGMADVATVLFTQFLKFDASTPSWPDRDRFVLSAGHGSMLLYGLLYLLGYEDMPLQQLKRFRQWSARTAGHPEVEPSAGIETTTGPLGQGLATAVGMAIAERHLAARFGSELVNHYTWVLASDGDLMEGLSHEAISLAGHLRLNRLIVLFDDNHVSIDGPTDLAESGNQPARFEAAGWAVSSVDGHNPKEIASALEAARENGKPTLIACRTLIGKGAPNKAGTAAVHGAPLGTEEWRAARRELGYDGQPFEVPDAVVERWREAGRRGNAERRTWEGRLEAAEETVRDTFLRALSGELPPITDKALTEFKRQLTEERPSMATRKASGAVLEKLTVAVPELIGGSADLTGSVNTKTKALDLLTAGNYGGRYIHYGVREHAMAAAMNGMALHGGVVPYGGTFLVFSDYARPAVRLSALMRRRVIYIFTHDSIGLGEDGPTHQPVEHLASLRAMPNLRVFRPADAMETAECWELALQYREGPSAIVLTRQGVPAVRQTANREHSSARGGYQLKSASAEPAVTLIATGSEVQVALEARESLEGLRIPARVVSIPCWELFAEQDAVYRNETLRPDTLRVGIEAASGFGWERWLGPDGIFIGMDGFGASAPYQDLYRNFGITAEAVVRAVRAAIGGREPGKKAAANAP
ncbi:MAG: transketolase [Alphaproteobacteria bacterium]